jgi:lipopolysaccharide export system protein LptA
MIRWIAMSGAAMAALAALALPGLASAAPGVGAIDTRSKAPIDMTANEAEVTQSKCLVVWRGAAEALQGQARLRADVISIYSTPKGKDASGQQSCGAAERIIADGHVYYVTPDQNARGDHAVYTEAGDQIVITGDVILVKGKDVARGDKLTLHVSTREAKLESNTVGVGKPGRVRAVYYPDTNPDTNGQSAGPAKP